MTRKTLKSVHSDINLKKFLNSLTKNQKSTLGKLIAASSPDNLRKTVYLSGGGKYYKYAHFVLEFTYKRGYVPIHPIETLNYYVSTLSHDFQKTEIVKDCFSLMLDCDELWVFDEKLPSYDENNSITGEKAISNFPEGVLAEIHFWLIYKPNSPIRFYTWKDAGVPKYDPETDWSLIPQKDVEEIELKQPSRFGIIDLGSSTVKLTICNLDSNKQTEVIHKKAITVNLAEGFFETKTLQKLPIERTIQAIIDLKEEALSYGILDLTLTGTGVVRSAKNIKEFSLKVKSDTGLEVKVLSGQDEARLIYEAVFTSFENKNFNIIVANAGGGSTEIVFGGKDYKEIKQYSLPIGISNLNEKFISDYPISNENYETMKKEIMTTIHKLIGKDQRKDHILVYTGGELDYMLITGFPLSEFQGSLAHPKKISLKSLKDYSAKLRKMTLKELQSFMPTNPNWMNGAIGSNTILEVLAEAFDVQTIIPSNKNLNDGILINIKK